MKSDQQLSSGWGAAQQKASGQVMALGDLSKVGRLAQACLAPFGQKNGGEKAGTAEWKMLDQTSRDEVSVLVPSQFIQYL